MRPTSSSASTAASASASPQIPIVECPREFRPAALRRLHDGLPSDQRAVMAQVLEHLDPADEGAWAGLLIAEGETIPPPVKGGGVIWVQRAAGNTAVVWATPEVGEVPAALLSAAAAFVDAHGIPLAQMVVGDRDGYPIEQLQRSGFPSFAALQYLFAEISPLSVESATSDDPTAPAREVEKRGPLQFVSRAGDQAQRLGNLLEQTYVGTLDCPGLDGIRPMSDVLEGYRRQGRHAPDDWYFVQSNGKDVGALLLAEHPGYGNWELVYMGVIPAARGQKHGDAIIRFALEVAARRGAERLVLAVDEGNAPALRAYQRAGFVVWDRRLVYARLRTPSQHSANVALPQL
jgi:mycothiol synthase